MAFKLIFHDHSSLFMGQWLCVIMYGYIILDKSLYIYKITNWHGIHRAQNRKALLWMIKTTQSISGTWASVSPKDTKQPDRQNKWWLCIFLQTTFESSFTLQLYKLLCLCQVTFRHVNCNCPTSYKRQFFCCLPVLQLLYQRKQIIFANTTAE